MSRPIWWDEACLALAAADPVFARLVEQSGGASLVSRGDPFSTLARSVVGQQISVKAAQSVWNRFIRTAMLRGEPMTDQPDDTAALAKLTMTPAAVLAMDHQALRGCGLSARKAEYLRDLAQHFESATVFPERWPALGDEAVIAELVQVRGIGRWTAEMFLIFNLQRPDVLPLDDIGLLRGIGKHWFDDAMPSRAQAKEIAQAWAPWRTAATWYLWRSLDPVPVEY
jgi:DNA-3-methyladenine glycosylase II